jgi:iron complex outermembrane receptor protein
MKYSLLASFILCSSVVSAQEDVRSDTANSLQEVVITGFQQNSTKYTSLNIEPYSLKQMNEKAPFNLSDALAKLPGISQISTGNAISKPVIRGLYGNRILVLYSGLRFDNQQWQDEHGLGLSQIGIDRVEVIKGPASLLYGSDAMGGVINVIEEKPLVEGKKVDVGTQLISNTLGTLTDAGYSSRVGNKWWRIRLGGESNADYSGGDNKRVLDSRNKGYYLKAGWGFEKLKWIQENSYNCSYNQYGFVIEDLSSFFVPDARWSRSMVGPHHNVLLNMLTSQNTFLLTSSILQLNAGVQSNRRMEDEGGGHISLDMHLLSGLESLRWEKALGSKVSFVANQQFTYENNTNYGGRILIPDATFAETNVSGYLRFVLNKVIIEAGVGGNNKNITTIATRSLSTPGEPMQPFSKDFIVGNGMLGVVYNPNGWFTVKTNAATGSRAPNLAELSSYGVHEGVYRFEIGDPNMKAEQNINADLTAEIDRRGWLLSASVFNNAFVNYVYLAPTGETKYLFPVYRYTQQDANIYGGEVFFNIHPSAFKGLQWKESFAYTRGDMKLGGNLPFIPANKLSSSIRYEKALNGKVNRVFMEPELVNVFNQDQPALFETPTSGYYLLNFSSGISINTPSGAWQLGIAGTNLTNEIYVDHLSRLKYIGNGKLYNQGINFVVTARKTFEWRGKRGRE